MADNLDLLLRVRGDASGAKNAVEETRKAITQLKDRIREVRTESDVGFRTERIQALNSRLTELNKTHQAAKDAAKQTAASHDDLASALSTLSPRLGSAAGALTGTVGPATAAAAGIVAVAAGVALLTKTFIDLTISTAAFQGKFFDLSQQVGVSVETLSTLDVVASTTGGNIDSVTASLGIFQKNLEAAHDPTSKEAKLLTELGVTSLNTEVALRQVIKGLFDLTDKQKQTNDVLELFGRGGRFVNAILKESKGDLNAATAEFQRMGLIVSSESAAAADQFNDSLEILSRQLAAVSRQLVAQSIPAFIVFFEDVNRAIGGNKAGWTSWADLIEFEVVVAIAALESFAQFVASRGVLGFFDQFEANVRRITTQAQELRSTLLAQGVAERAASLAVGGRVGDRPDPGDGKKAAAAAQARAAKEIQLIQRELEEKTRVHRLALERERDLDLKSIEDWAKEATDQAFKYLAGQQAVFEQERANAQKFIKNKQDLSLALREIDQKDAKAQNELFITLNRVEDEAKKRRDQATIATERQLSQIRVAQREGEIERINALLDRQAINERVAIERIIAIEAEAHKERVLLIDTELALQTTSAARAEELTNLKAEAEQRYTDRFKQLTQDRIDAMATEAQAAGDLSNRDLGINENVIVPDIESRLGLPPPERILSLSDAFDTLGQNIASALNIGAENGQAFADIMKNAFDDLANAIGSLIYNWVLLGETGPKAMRKLVASVLAGVAAQAAVKAIYELAEGFAALFFNPAAAAAHFKAAALFGAVAGVAAVAGRGIAGDAFQRNDKQGGSEGRSGSGQLNPLTLPRNQPQTQTIRVEIVTKDSEFGRAITAHVLNDVTTAGPLREAFANDGVLP